MKTQFVKIIEYIDNLVWIAVLVSKRGHVSRKLGKGIRSNHVPKVVYVLHCRR